jgi:hypothetical protein
METENIICKQCREDFANSKIYWIENSLSFCSIKYIQNYINWYQSKFKVFT